MVLSCIKDFSRFNRVTWRIQGYKLWKLRLNISNLFSIQEAHFHNDLGLKWLLFWSSSNISKGVNHDRILLFLLFQIRKGFANRLDIFVDQLDPDFRYCQACLASWNGKNIIASASNRLFSISANEFRTNLPIFWFHSRNAIWLWPIKCMFFTASSLTGRLYNFSFRSSSAASKASFRFSKWLQNHILQSR